MANTSDPTVPQSPETQPPEVREELDQAQISHDGAARGSDESEMSSNFGAVETEVTPITPPMAGPDDLVGDEESAADVGIDPADEITPG